MKITNVETHLVRLPFDTGGGDGFAFTDWPSLDYVLVRIDTEDGITGWGDAFGYGAAFATRAAVDRMIAPVTIRRALGHPIPLDEPAGAPLPRIC